MNGWREPPYEVCQHQYQHSWCFGLRVNRLRMPYESLSPGGFMRDPKVTPETVMTTASVCYKAMDIFIIPYLTARLYRWYITQHTKYANIGNWPWCCPSRQAHFLDDLYKWFITQTTLWENESSYFHKYAAKLSCSNFDRAAVIGNRATICCQLVAN